MTFRELRLRSKVELMAAGTSRKSVGVLARTARDLTTGTASSAADVMLAGVAVRLAWGGSSTAAGADRTPLETVTMATRTVVENFMVASFDCSFLVEGRNSVDLEVCKMRERREREVIALAVIEILENVSLEVL